MGLPLQPQQVYTCFRSHVTVCHAFCDYLRHDFVRIQADQGGSIDPSVFTDSDGKRWLLFKNDGNAVDQPTYIYLRPLSSDALQVLLYNNALGIAQVSLCHREMLESCPVFGQRSAISSSPEHLNPPQVYL